MTKPVDLFPAARRRAHSLVRWLPRDALVAVSTQGERRFLLHQAEDLLDPDAADRIRVEVVNTVARAEWFCRLPGSIVVDQSVEDLGRVSILRLLLAERDRRNESKRRKA